jgi:hypothetical protein
MNKRLILVIGIIALLLLLVVGGLVYAVKKQKPAPVVQIAPQVKKILDEAVISPVPSFDNNAIWYFNSEGRLFRVSIDGSDLTEFPLPALPSGYLKKVLWPKSGSDFMAIISSSPNEIKNYYNSEQKTYVALAPNIQSVDWLPDSKRIIYVWKSADNVHQQLAVANADGTGFLKVKDVFWPDLMVKAGNDGKTVLLYRSSADSDVNKIYYANLDSGEIGTAVDSGKTISAAWLPTGSRFVFAQASITAYPKLYLYDFINKQVVDLSLNTTLDKIAFDKDGKYLIAAVPKKDNTGDAFVKIDLTNFKQEIYFESNQNVRATGLFLIGNQLYFVSSQDQKLYTISK